MKKLNESINEAMSVQYRVSFLGAKDNEDMPFTVTVLVDKANVKEFEKFLEDEEGNTFMHADGGNVEY